MKDNALLFKLGKTVFGIKVTDVISKEWSNAIFSYLTEPDFIDAKAIGILLEEAYYTNTYRPCYAAFVTKIIKYICLWS